MVLAVSPGCLFTKRNGKQYNLHLVFPSIPDLNPSFSTRTVPQTMKALSRGFHHYTFQPPPPFFFFVYSGKIPSVKLLQREGPISLPPWNTDSHEHLRPRNNTRRLKKKFETFVSIRANKDEVSVRRMNDYLKTLKRRYHGPEKTKSPWHLIQNIRNLWFSPGVVYSSVGRLTEEKKPLVLCRFLLGD